MIVFYNKEKSHISFYLSIYLSIYQSVCLSIDLNLLIIMYIIFKYLFIYCKHSNLVITHEKVWRSHKKCFFCFTLNVTGQRQAKYVKGLNLVKIFSPFCHSTYNQKKVFHSVRMIRAKRKGKQDSQLRKDYKLFYVAFFVSFFVCLFLSFFLFIHLFVALLMTIIPFPFLN